MSEAGGAGGATKATFGVRREGREGEGGHVSELGAEVRKIESHRVQRGGGGGGSSVEEVESKAPKLETALRSKQVNGREGERRAPREYCRFLASLAFSHLDDMRCAFHSMQELSNGRADSLRAGLVLNAIG